MALVPPPPPIDLPVTAVTVYSDRARVTRSAEVPIGGRGRIALPLLPERTDVSSIRLEAAGAEVQQVDIRHVDGAPAAADEGRALLAELERLDDDIARRRGGRAVLAEGVSALHRLAPTLPDSDAARPYPRLGAGGWDGVFSFVRSYSERTQRRVRDLDAQLEDLGRRRAQLAERARLLGASPRRAGYQVIATLAGEGKARVSLVYLIGGARWLPTYDIQLRPAEGRVELSFAGTVSQESGEDWDGAQLTLSTAVPATTVELPRLTTWKLGERERFLPASRPVSPPAAQAAPAKPAAPPPAPPPPPAQPVEEEVRAALRQRAQGPREVEVNQEILQNTAVRGRTYESVIALAPGAAEKTRKEEPAGKDRDGDAIHDQVDKADEPRRVYKQVAERTVQTVSESRMRSLPGAAAGFSFRRREPEATQTLGLAPPPGYAPPSLGAELPASQAGGYDLSYPAAVRETVRSGKGGRRVPLFSTAWPVTVHHKLYPALGEEAYLVAEIKNPMKGPLPGGQAQLAVGADAAGVAALKLVAPGEVFTLPLGIDRDVKSLRTVRMTTAERGVFNKDEITEYVVTSEIANPHRRPLVVRVVDQIPTTQNREIEIRLLRSEPQATLDADKGTLEWRLGVSPGAKAKVQFVYTLRRPKGARLVQ